VFPDRGGDEGDENDVPDKDEVENEGEVEEDEGDREAMHQSLQTYVHQHASSPQCNDADSEAAPLPEQPPANIRVLFVRLFSSSIHKHNQKTGFPNSCSPLNFIPGTI
jgi:hypothetical protein